MIISNIEGGHKQSSGRSPKKKPSPGSSSAQRGPGRPSRVFSVQMLTAVLVLSCGVNGIPILGPTLGSGAKTTPSALTALTQIGSYAYTQAQPQATQQAYAPALQQQQQNVQPYYAQTSSAATTASDLLRQSQIAEAQELQQAQIASSLASSNIWQNLGQRKRTSLFDDNLDSGLAQSQTQKILAEDKDKQPVATDQFAQTVRDDASQKISASLQPQQVVLVADDMPPAPVWAPIQQQPQLQPQPQQLFVPILPDITPQSSTASTAQIQQPQVQPAPIIIPQQQATIIPVVQQQQSIAPTDFNSVQPVAKIPDAQQQQKQQPESGVIYQSPIIMPYAGTTVPQTLSSLTQTKAAIEEAPLISQPMARQILPIPKPMIIQQDPIKPILAASSKVPTTQEELMYAGLNQFQEEDSATNAAEVFIDAFGQQQLGLSYNSASNVPKLEGPRSSRFSEQIHQVMNVASVLIIVSFVALQRNASIDLSKLFINEEQRRHLSRPFETLIHQSVLLALLAGSVVFSLWNAGFLDSEESNKEVNIAAECSIVVCIIWMVAGGLLLRKAQSQIATWRKIEETATDVEYLKMKEQQYERLYYQKSRNPELELPMDLIEEMQHLVQRTHFINPVYLPALTESFLARDFDYAEYLSISLGNAIDEHLKTHFISMLSCLPLLVIFYLSMATEPRSIPIEQLDIEISSTMICNTLCVIAFMSIFGVYSYLYYDLNSIQQALFPQILLDPVRQKQEYDDDYEINEQCGGVPPPMRQPEALSLHQTMSSQDMFSPYDDLPVPDYLDQECLAEFENRLSPFRCILGQDKLATLSKHETLFGLTKSSRYWHAGILQIVQLTLVIGSAWTIASMTAQLGGIVASLGDTAASTQIPIKLILPILQLNMLAVSYKIFCQWLPTLLKTYVVATSTEMMKDRSLIETVVQGQKKEKNDRHYRVFQAMRLIRREYMKMLFPDNVSENDTGSEYGEESTARTIQTESLVGHLQVPEKTKRLKEITAKHILENFQKIGKPGDRYSHRRSTHSDADESDSSSMRSISYRYGSSEDANLVIGVDQIKQMVSMCGGELKDFEKKNLLRRSNYGTLDSTQDITCNDFTEAVESYMNDANTDPYALVLYLFKMKFGIEDSLIYLSDVKAFLKEFEAYFEGDDLNRFVKDLEYGLRLEGDRVQVSQIAALIKHASEGFPK